MLNTKMTAILDSQFWWCLKLEPPFLQQGINNVTVMFKIHWCLQEAPFLQQGINNVSVMIKINCCLQEPPFLQQGINNATGEKILEGFIADLVSKIARRIHTPYTLKLVSEGGYGVPKEDGSWNGLLGEVIRGVSEVN